jgi:Tfp pilus assembly protein PilN
MYKQEINLYKHFAELNTDISPFSKKRLLLSWSLFIILSFILYFGSLWEIHQLGQENKQLISQENKLKSTFFALKNQYPALFFSQDAEATMTRMEAEITEQEKIFKSVQDNIPFSTYLTALANTIVPNVWLTSITIQNSGDEMSLKGEALDKNELQGFLEAIQSNSLFKPFKLESQDIGNTGNSDSDKHLNFEITLMKKQHE